MYFIRVHPDSLREAAQVLAYRSRSVAAIGEELQRAVHHLDLGAWDGWSRARAESLLSRVGPESRHLAEQLEDLSRKLARAADEFEQTDNFAANPWTSVFERISAFAEGVSEWRDSLHTRLWLRCCEKIAGDRGIGAMAVAITLQLPEPLRGTKDLEVPENVPVRHLTVALIQALQVPTAISGWLVDYRLGRNGQPFPDNRTLDELGVKMGDRLELIRYSLQLPYRGGRPIAGSASLQFVSGQPVLLDHLGKPELLIGRGDPRKGLRPDIDLSVQPGGETVSRTHARLRKQGDQWVLIPLPSRNGTFVGGTLLPPHQPYVLRPGDVIGFGSVRCIFTAAAP